jgi:hypothetical protein
VPKPRRNRIREERIHNEIIVDAYGPEEQALGWYYYLENKVQFPFTARCIVSKAVSPLRKGETVEVRSLAPEDSCAYDMLVFIPWHGRNVTVPLSQLTANDADESTSRPLVTGTTGWRKATVSASSSSVESYPCASTEDSYDKT